MKQAILELIRDYESRTMKLAENLYIGRDTWMQIRHELRQEEIWPSMATHVNRPQCLGLWVFIVDADEHLKVG